MWQSFQQVIQSSSEAGPLRGKPEKTAEIAAVGAAPKTQMKGALKGFSRWEKSISDFIEHFLHPCNLLSLFS